jgi:hypothetical protein
MKTVFSLVILVIYGAIAGFVMVLVLNLAGLPGALLAGKPGIRSKRQFIFGSLVAAIGQSYVNLAFVAFMVSWTKLAAERDDVVGILLWPVAFLAVAIPTLINLSRARIESRNQEHAIAQVEAIHITFLATLTAFPLFAFVPWFMKPWAWVPYVSRAMEGFVG